jgi:hypothetical protein
MRAIYVPHRSSSDQSIKLLSLHSGDGFIFLDLPLARIVDQPAYQSVSWLSAIATSHCGFEFIQAGGEAHVIS